MPQADRNRIRRLAILTLGFVFLFTAVIYAADPPFAGKWKGESKPAAAPARGAGGAPEAAAPAPGAPGGAAATGGAPAAPAGGGGGGGRGGFGGGGGRGGFGGGGGFGGSGGFGGPQKVTLNLKQSKEGKVSGNITLGESDTNDVKEGKADGNFLTFKAGRSPAILDYKAELKDGQMILTSTSSDGRGRTTEYVLTKK